MMPGPRGARRGIRLWLIALFLLVATMIAVGGLTRLTDSRAVDHRMEAGDRRAAAVDEAEPGQAEFQKYQAIPEYQLQNKGMSLEAFKIIYWWEWGHRQLGPGDRAWSGLLGFVGFARDTADPVGLDRAAVASGRAGRAAGGDRVVDGLLGPERRPGGCGKLPAGDASGAGLRDPWVPGLVCLPAGPKRGRADDGAAGAGGEAVRPVHRPDAFRLPADRAGRAGGGDRRGAGVSDLAPDERAVLPGGCLLCAGRAGGSLPVWHAFFENPGLVQFIHRMSGYLLLAFGVVVWLRGRKSSYQATRAAFHAVMAMLVAQMVLGIVTVLTVAHAACGDHPPDRRGDPVGADPAGAASVAIPRGGVDPGGHGMTRV